MKSISNALAGFIALAAASGAAHAVPVQWTVASGGNDHWYEYIAGPVTWQQARAAALASSFMGMQGYLATITSAGENRFALADPQVGNGNLAWLGGSDEGVEGTWRWMDGPEAGLAFWQFTGPGQFDGTTLIFANWNGAEPNDCCNGEDYLHGNFAVALGWNDHGGPGGNAGQANGYIIEYSAAAVVPLPATAMLIAPALLMLGRRKGTAR